MKKIKNKDYQKPPPDYSDTLKTILNVISGTIIIMLMLITLILQMIDTILS